VARGWLTLAASWQSRPSALLLIHGVWLWQRPLRQQAGPLVGGGLVRLWPRLIGFGIRPAGPPPRQSPLGAPGGQGFLEEVVQATGLCWWGQFVGTLVALAAAVSFPAGVAAVAACHLPDPTLLVAVPRRGPPGRRRCKGLW